MGLGKRSVREGVPERVSPRRNISMAKHLNHRTSIATNIVRIKKSKCSRLTGHPELRPKSR